jgi:hypothetical protein
MTTGSNVSKARHVVTLRRGRPHAALPGEELWGRDPGRAEQRRILDKANLLGGASAAAALNGSDHFDPSMGVIRNFGHSRIDGHMPMLAALLK